MKKYTLQFKGTKIDGTKGNEEIITIWASGYDDKISQGNNIAKKMMEDNKDFWEIRWEDINFGQGYYVSDFKRLHSKVGDSF